MKAIALLLAAALRAAAAPGGDRRVEPLIVRDSAGTLAALRAVAAAAPETASVLSIGRTHEGRDIWALRLNARARGDAPSELPGIVFVGTIHAREHLATEVPLELARRLADPANAGLLGGRDVYFIPMLNPDGVEYDIAHGYVNHRKNARPGPEGAVGVDLNRNFPLFWGGEGSTDLPADSRYRGPSPFSEPETRAFEAFVMARPNLRAVLSYHTFGRTMGYPWAGTAAPVSDGEALMQMRALAGGMADRAGYRLIQNSGLYVASGDLCDWAWGRRGLLCVTVEMTPPAGAPDADPETESFYPGATSVAGAVRENWPAAVYALEAFADPLRRSASR